MIFWLPNSKEIKFLIVKGRIINLPLLDDNKYPG